MSTPTASPNENIGFIVSIPGSQRYEVLCQLATEGCKAMIILGQNPDGSLRETIELVGPGETLEIELRRQQAERHEEIFADLLSGKRYVCVKCGGIFDSPAAKAEEMTEGWIVYLCADCIRLPEPNKETP